MTLPSCMRLLAVLHGLVVVGALGLRAEGASAQLAIHIDGSERSVDEPNRGAEGRAAWEAAARSIGGRIVTDDFDGINIDVPEGVPTAVGNFDVYFEQTGGYSPLAGNTASEPHPTGNFVGTTGTGSVAGGNAETIDGLELRYETAGPFTELLELRFDPPVHAWAADVYSVDGVGFGQSGGPDSNDHTTLYVLDYQLDLTELLPYAGSGYMGFLGIVSRVPFSAIRFTAEGDGDRFRLDNVSLLR